MTDWQFLDEWAPPDGTWAMLWPGYYGPFTAFRNNGGWTLCVDLDLDKAMLGRAIAMPDPHMTDAFPQHEPPAPYWRSALDLPDGDGDVLWYHPDFGMAVHSVKCRWPGTTHWAPLPPEPEET